MDMDPKAITGALSGINAAIQIAKTVRNAESSLAAAELKMQLAELMEKLADAKVHVATVQADSVEKDQLIAELRAQLALASEMVFEHPFYYRVTDDKRDGPFCQRCFDADRKAVRLIENRASSDDWICHACEAEYFGPAYQRPRAAFSGGSRESILTKRF